MRGFDDKRDGGSAVTRGRNSTGILVCVVGIDGAGKSTLAKAMTSVIGERGIKCDYVWGGFNSSFTIFRPVVALMKRTVFRGDRYMEDSSTKGRVLRSSLLSTIYQCLVLVDYVLQALVRIRLPLGMGRNVVCDRYIYDVSASIGVLLEWPIERTLALLDWSLAVLPRPQLAFLIDLPEELAYERKDDIMSLDFLSVRRNTYLQMAERHGMRVLDGSSDPRQLTQVVVAQVQQLFAGAS